MSPDIDIVIEAVRAALMIQREDSTPELVGRANEEIVQAIQQLSNIPEMDCQFEQKVYDSLQYYIHELSFWIHMSVRRPLKTRRNAHQSRNVIENSRPSTTQEQLIARVLHLDTRIENDLGRIRPLNLSHVPHAISHSLLNSSSENARIRAKLLEQIHRHRESRSDSQRPNTTSLFNTISHIKQPVITLDSSLLAVKNSASQLVHSRLNLLFNSFLAELNCEMDAHWKASAEQMHYRLEPIDILLSALSGTAISP